MKKSIFVLLIAFSATILCAQKKDRSNKIFQEEEVVTESFVRKGRVLVETGYNLFGALPIGSATGFTSLSDENNSLSGLGFNGGYFIMEDLALKLNYSILGGDGSSINSLGLGAKYYIIGKVPIDLSFGRIGGDGFGEDINFTTLSLGYGIKLADNINLEPSIGVFRNDEVSLRTFNLNFAMFL